MTAKDPEATRAALQQHIVHSGELLAAHFNARAAAAQTDAAHADDAHADDARGLASA